MGFVDWIRARGACFLLILTLLQVVFFIGYSVLYTVVFKKYHKDDTVTRTELYQWISILILVAGMFYFLWQSLKYKGPGKLKNPNELFSYLALAVINNCIFFAKLCYYAVHVKRDWIDEPNPPDSPDNLDQLTLLLFIMTFVSLLGVVLIVIFVILTAKPLREYIFEEIFHEIGANINAVEQHKAKTAFFGTNKVDLITHLLYLNTLAFLCYDFTLQNGLDDTPYWITLGVFAALLLLNNIHGYYTMNTTASSFNSKFYFVTRSVLQIFYIYLSLSLVLDRSLAWKDLSIDEHKTEVETLRIVCIVVCAFSTVIYVILIITAQKLLKITTRTEFDHIRNQDGQLYESIKKINHSERAEV